MPIENRSVYLNVTQLFENCVSSVCSLAQSCQTLCNPCTAARHASLSILNSQRLLKLMSIQLLMTSNCLILCHPLLFLPSTFASIRVLSNELALHIRWPKYYSFSNEYSNEYWNIPMNIQDLFPLGLTLPIMYLRRKCQPTPVFLLGESH